MGVACKKLQLHTSQADCLLELLSNPRERIKMSMSCPSVDFSMDVLKKESIKFLLGNNREAILSVLKVQSRVEHVGVAISLTELASRAPTVAEYVFRNPTKGLEILETSLLNAQNELMEEYIRTGVESAVSCSVKENVHARLFGPPGRLNGCEKPVSADLIGCLVTMTGTVARTGLVKALESRKFFQCAECGYQFAVVLDVDGSDFSLPRSCPRDSGACASSSFT